MHCLEFFIRIVRYNERYEDMLKEFLQTEGL